MSDTLIDVKVRLEAGYEPALHGMALSHSLDVEYPLTERKIERANKLAHKQGGHNKFLESMILWIEVIAPRYWWQQADTYRIASKQSESTMHTMLKQELSAEHFVEPPPEEWLWYLNGLIRNKELEKVKRLLPEGFWQKRMWCLSYKTLQNIYLQRKQHKLKEWQDFFAQVLEQIDHPEFIAP